MAKMNFLKILKIDSEDIESNFMEDLINNRLHVINSQELSIV